MHRTWAAEIVVDAALARVLIEVQFPNLSPVILEPLGFGWDNTVYRVNERFVFRFPRREIAVSLIQTELRCLPILGPRLPAPIPLPAYAGRPSPEYPWPFAGYAYLRGSRMPQTADLAGRRRIAVAIAAFLRTLHDIAPPDLPEHAIPYDTLDRLNTRKRRSATESRLAAVQSAGLVADIEPILAILDSAPEAPPEPTRLVVAHGDLHVGQLLVTDQLDLAGVIDWGDLHLGDAAVDLAIAHQMIPASLHEAFLAAYGPVDSTTWLLARARATWHAVALLASGADARDDARVAEAMTALAFITGGTPVDAATAGD